MQNGVSFAGIFLSSLYTPKNQKKTKKKLGVLKLLSAPKMGQMS